MARLPVVYDANVLSAIATETVRRSVFPTPTTSTSSLPPGTQERR